MSTSLPLDCTTTIGIIVALATILSAKGLNPDTLDRCTKIMNRLGGFGCFSYRVPLLPNQPNFVLVVVNNMVDKEDVENWMKKFDLDPRRQGMDWVYLSINNGSMN